VQKDARSDAHQVSTDNGKATGTQNTTAAMNRTFHGAKDQILNMVLADDDEDDRLFFQEAIEEIEIRTRLLMFQHGQELMDHLGKGDAILPDLIFLDLNMPIKTGMQCLRE